MSKLNPSKKKPIIGGNKYHCVQGVAKTYGGVVFNVQMSNKDKVVVYFTLKPNFTPKCHANYTLMLKGINRYVIMRIKHE